MAYTLEQQKANRKKWVEALRSGEYRQVEAMLHDDGGFCCLGVLACVAGKRVEQLGSERTLRSFKDVMDFVGLSEGSGTFIQHLAGDYDEDTIYGELTDLNDNGKTFAEIADIIESEPLGLFAESV